MRRFIPWICLLLVFLPLTVTSTPPAQPLLNSYRLDGRLFTPLGRPVVGARVAFATHCHGSILVLDEVNGCTCSQGDEPGHPSDRTALDGSFSLDLVSCELFDSLAVAVVEPDHTIITKQVVAVKDAQQQDWNQQVPDQSTSYFFCATSTGFSTVHIGTVYSFSDHAVTMSPGNR